MTSRVQLLLRGAGLAAVLLLGSLAPGGRAAAAAQCRGAGYLCIYDFASGRTGNFSSYNPNWGIYGWNDRADWFRNDGRTHTACVYKYTSYRSPFITILKGDIVWPGNDFQANFGRSNNWTLGACRR